jgi:hypothetical protein
MLHFGPLLNIFWLEVFANSGHVAVVTSRKTNGDFLGPAWIQEKWNPNFGEGEGGHR